MRRYLKIGDIVSQWDIRTRLGRVVDTRETQTTSREVRVDWDKGGFSWEQEWFLGLESKE